MSIDLNEIASIARAAGRAILEIYERDFSIAEKEDRSPLTEADLASHRVILEELNRLTPALPILSEESASIPFATRRNWHRYWLVDPLDGTKEFIKRNGEFTVNIALIENGVPTCGVVHVPVSGTLYIGQASQGAFREDGTGNRQPIWATTKRPAILRVAGSRSHAGDSLKLFLARIGKHELVSMGSSLKLCLVAEGSADLYPRLGPTSEWDTAAAQAVVEAAGGRVTNLDLTPLRYNEKESLLNPYFLVFGDASVRWDQLLEAEMRMP